MLSLSFEEARACVLEQTRARAKTPGAESIPALQSAGRVLAEDILADRDYPPFPRSARDGYAVRSADLPGELRIIGEVRAGQVFVGDVKAGEAVEIMTGAPLPDGADAVVMIEQTERSGDRLRIDRAHASGDNFNPRGLEAAAGAIVMKPGQRLGFAEIALLATVGRTSVKVYRRPRVAVLPTGDEVVEAGEMPQPFQIRNSNAWSLAVQVERAGGDPNILAIARDTHESTRALVEQGLTHDLLLLSGGVSAGKYDVVEQVLGDLGGDFFFTRVRIQPGQPVVFGAARGTLFFGLPGNPASTMVTFEVFARAAVELLGGASDATLPMLHARMWKGFRQKPGLTRFLPAHVTHDGATVEPLTWHGSGDVASLARANAFIVTEPDRETWSTGDWIRVILK